MDLTTLYNLTTTELRAEAERLGVRDTYALSRAQLIHAIRGRAGAPQPEGLFGRVIGFARRALQTAATTETEASPEARPSPSAEPATREVASVPAAKEAPAGAAPAPAADDEAADLGPAPSSSPTSAPKPPGPKPPSPAGPKPAAPAAPASSTPPARAPAGVFSGPTATFEEPFPTRTMARILAEQGHFKRSLAIYASLLRSAPDDDELEREVSEVRSRSRARRTQPR